MADNPFPKNVLIVIAEIDAECEADWNRWYDEVHLPDALACPGVIAGQRFKSNGQLQLESKDHIKERLTHSPDLGDAAALTFGIEIEPEATKVDDPYSVGMSNSGGWLSG